MFESGALIHFSLLNSFATGTTELRKFRAQEHFEKVNPSTSGGQGPLALRRTLRLCQDGVVLNYFSQFHDGMSKSISYEALYACHVDTRYSSNASRLPPELFNSASGR